jgi:integrase
MPRSRLDGTPPSAPNKKKLTSLTVQRLKPMAGAYLVWDIMQRGLAVNVQPSGYRSYKVIYSRHGKPRWVHLSACNAIGLADARKLAAGIMLEVAMGKDPAAERKAERSSGTFAELAECYVEQYARKKNKSWKQAAALVTRHLLPRWGSLRAADISRSDVRSMMAGIGTGAPVVANQVLAAASAIFSWSIRAEIGGVTVNPCHGVERNATTSRERVLSDSEVPLFWAAFDAAGLFRSAALKLVLLLGQRPGEVGAMHRAHIVDGWWTLPGQPVPALNWPGTKNGETHRVWLPQPALDLLAELDDGVVGPVFLRLGSLDSAMREICAKLRVNEKATPHDLRRTHGTTVAALGFGRDAMNRIQNHRDGGIASVYDRHQYADENRRVMEAVAARILALATGAPFAIAAE